MAIASANARSRASAFSASCRERSQCPNWLRSPVGDHQTGQGGRDRVEQSICEQGWLLLDSRGEQHKQRGAFDNEVEQLCGRRLFRGSIVRDQILAEHGHQHPRVSARFQRAPPVIEVPAVEPEVSFNERWGDR